MDLKKRFKNYMKGKNSERITYDEVADIPLAIEKFN